MVNSSKYWNYATVAAILIGICNILPTYLDFFLSTTAFSSLGLIWKIVTSFLILMMVGKRLISEETEYPYGKCFGWCYLSSLLSSLVEGLLSILYVQVVDTGYLEKMRSMTMQILENNPAANQEMLDSFNTTLNSFLTPSGILMSTIISAAICGAIMSLIVAAVIKKRQDITEDIDE